MTIINSIGNVINAIISGIADFFSNVANLISTLKDLISNFFTFIYDLLYLIPSPFSQILQITITILVAIFIVKVVGSLL